MVVGSTDAAGQISFGSGGSPAVGSQVTVTFQHAYPTAPTVVAGSANLATPSRQLYVGNVTVNGFDIGFVAAPTAYKPVGTYRVNYRVN